MRVLLLTQDFPPGFVGGVASWAWDAAWSLHAAGHEVRVLARRTGDTQSIDDAAPFGIQRVWGRSWGRWQGRWLGWAARRHLRWADRVLAATWPCAVGLPRVGCPLWVGVHGSEITRLGEAPPALIRLAPKVNRWFAVSRYLAGRLRSCLGGHPPVDVVPMPLSLDTGALVPAASRVGLLVLARLTPLKGADRALQLAARLGEPLTLVGEGPVRGALEAAAPETVRFLGALPRTEALDHLSRARALVLLPRTLPDGRGAEGLGLVALEGAARGTPTVGCRTGGLPEAVGPGLVVDNPDRPELGPVQALLSDPDAGARVRRWVAAHHGPAAFVKALEGG